jgi:oligoribonuclease
MKMDKKLVPTKLLWLDLEMTGLDPKADVILEVAVEITDFNFNTLASYEAHVKQDRSIVLERMQKNNWWADYPANRDDFIKNLSSGKPLAQIEKELASLVEEEFGNEPATLAGNSIYNDRMFIKNYLPELELKLHYRMVDVSSLKIIMQSKYNVSYTKPEAHRAYEDVQASIAELQYYLEKLNRI